MGIRRRQITEDLECHSNLLEVLHDHELNLHPESSKSSGGFKQGSDALICV